MENNINGQLESDRTKVWISVENDPAQSALRVEVSNSLLPVLTQLLARLRRLFDLEATPQHIATHLAPCCRDHPGLRIPGAFDGFEMAVRAILGQQISVKAATTLAGRLTNQFGQPIVTPFPGLTHLSPTAPVIAAATMDELTRHGITQSRAAINSCDRSSRRERISLRSMLRFRSIMSWQS